MKRMFLLLLVLFVSFLSVAGAQQSATKPPVGTPSQWRHLRANQNSGTTGMAAANIQSNPNQATRIWELGIFPGGTWAGLTDINDSGVLVGLGDVPPIGSNGFGYTHTLLMPLFGPNAGEWVDLGTLGGEQSNAGWEEPFPVKISNTGLVTSHSTAPDGQVHAVAWTKESGMIDLGTLADSGDGEYPNYNSSYGGATNKLGTLIVGWSGVN